MTPGDDRFHNRVLVVPLALVLVAVVVGGRGDVGDAGLPSAELYLSQVLVLGGGFGGGGAFDGLDCRDVAAVVVAPAGLDRGGVSPVRMQRDVVGVGVTDGWFGGIGGWRRRGCRRSG